MKRVSVILGTRPEAIKLAPVILALKRVREIRCHVCVTAQHREMLDQVLAVFDLVPDTDLDLMQPNQTLAGFTARALAALDGCLAGPSRLRLGTRNPELGTRQRSLIEPLPYLPFVALMDRARLILGIIP